MKQMTSTLRASFMLVTLMTVLLGGLYPLLVTGISQSLFAYRANGSMIERGGKIVGSSLIGQEFTSPKYFWARLSATTPPYNPSASSGSNLGANNPKLMEAAKARIDALHKADPKNTLPVPMDLVTSSASGLDPHISLAAAHYQLARVAKARAMSEADVQLLIDRATETTGFGLVGKPNVNVVRLNLRLDEWALESHKEKR